MNYDFPSKRHWRRSLWNCVASRLQQPTREALVLYLAGENDEDSAVAIQKGFSRNNLIAIERDEGIAASLRSAGTLTLVGDAFAHIRAWRPDRRVDAVVLDLCGGMTVHTLDEVTSMLADPHLQGAVIAVNMLRGRDGQGNEARKYLSTSMNHITADATGMAARSRAVRLGLVTETQFADAFARYVGGDGTSKSRAELLRHSILRTWLLYALPNVEIADDGSISVLKYELSDGERRVTQARLGAMLAAAQFQTLSYRSTAHQTFDTLVWVNSLHRGGLNLSWLAQKLDEEHRNSSHRRQQAAVLAHRSRRAA